jgi:hypothetical protein
MNIIMTSSPLHLVWTSSSSPASPTHILAAELEQTVLLLSRLLSPPARYYVREMRLLANDQLLESTRHLRSPRSRTRSA